VGAVDLAVALGFCAAFAGAWGVDAAVRDARERSRSLAALGARGARPGGLVSLRARLAAIGALALPRAEAEREAHRARLRAAGVAAPDALALAFGLRLAAAALLAAIGAALGLARGSGAHALACAAIAAAAGYWSLDLALVAAARRRVARIFRELPDVLDLSLIAMEAGLGFDAAIARAAEDLDALAPVLAGELRRYGLEVRSGVDRELALRGLALRCGTPAMGGVVSVLIQSGRYGTDVSHALRESARSLRLERRQQAQERAAQAPVRITFPLVLFILPALMLVVAGPALIRLFERLSP
jgi:tight adherence protein C